MKLGSRIAGVKPENTSELGSNTNSRSTHDRTKFGRNSTTAASGVRIATIDRQADNRTDLAIWSRSRYWWGDHQITHTTTINGTSLNGPHTGSTTSCSGASASTYGTSYDITSYYKHFCLTYGFSGLASLVQKNFSLHPWNAYGIVYENMNFVLGSWSRHRAWVEVKISNFSKRWEH